MTPTIKAALTPIADCLVQLEYARDLDHARAVFADLGLCVQALGEVLADERGPKPALVPVALTNCRSCQHDAIGFCHSNERGVGAWINRNCTGNEPDEGATGCPGWKAREPEETAEMLAGRLGLRLDEGGTYVYGTPGIPTVWATAGGSVWEMRSDAAVFPDALTALRAYAASVGK